MCVCVCVDAQCSPFVQSFVVILDVCYFFWVEGVCLSLWVCVSVGALSVGAFEKARGLGLAGEAKTDTPRARVGAVAVCVYVCVCVSEWQWW